MDEILDGNYKMNKFQIGSVIESCNPYKSDKIVVDFETTADGVGIYTVELAGDSEGIRTEFTQEYIESEYHLKEGEGDEN
jgi:hypothetical protein